MAESTLEGSALLFQCPTCKGPMSVRLYLLEAECWQCGTRIEISEAQRAALQAAKSNLALTTQGVQPLRIDPAHRKPIQSSTTAAKSPTSQDSAIQDRPRERVEEAPRPILKSSPLMAPPIVRSPLLAPPIEPTRGRRSQVRIVQPIFDILKVAPAWLVSLLAHLAILVLLAILSTEEDEDRGILLSLAFSPLRQHGDIVSLAPANPRAYDLPLPEQLNPDDPNDAGLIREATDLANQLQEPNYATGYRPAAVDSLRAHLHQPYDVRNGLLARDIRVRSEVLKANGGTLLTEAAVAKALRWIASQQKSDGSWRLDSLSYNPGRGTLASRSAATSLALLPFLGAGQTHRSGMYREHVQSGINYLLRLQEENGDLRDGTLGEAGMYVQGQGAIVLGEAFAMTHDESLREPVERAVRFIVASQHEQGGWRYRPKMPGDTSVLGWQLMALQSARMAGVEVPGRTLERANRFLDSVRNPNGVTYGYMPGHKPSPSMTAEAILCRLYLGSHRDDANIREGLGLLLQDFPPSPRHVDYYYWYYATQAFHHVGGELWREWNDAIKVLLIEKQLQQGRNAGSWNVEGYLSDAGGRLYITSLATCTLEVYYRHLPLFETLQ